jgi:uncharacterized phage protein (TIGR02216 family)
MTECIAFPWRETMAFGLGVLRLSPTEFWNSTFPELKAAARGMRGEFASTDPLSRQDLSVLMRLFPDHLSS